jgi:hypothetical protein
MTIAMALVLPVMVNVSGRPFVTVAVMGTINDLPAGTVTFAIGEITGAANNSPAAAMNQQTHIARYLVVIRDFLVNLLFMPDVHSGHASLNQNRSANAIS